MKMFDDYTFVDCLLVDFEYSSSARELSVKVEAYGTTPDNAGKEKGLLWIKCSGLSDMRTRIEPEFWLDLLKPYSAEGEDQRANEITGMVATLQDTSLWRVRISTDMLDVELACAAVDLSFVPFSAGNPRRGRHRGPVMRSAPVSTLKG